MPKSATSAEPSWSSVLRLDVAVDHPVPVGIVQRARHLLGDPDRLRHRELLLAGEPVAQGLPFDIGHDVEEGAVRLAGVEQGQDVGMLQIGRELDLGQEPLGPDHGGELGAEDLQGHPPGVADVLGQVDGGHSAGADFALQAVAVGQGALQATQQLRHRGLLGGDERKMRTRAPGR